jgi:LAO/AO transport system kinase
MKPVPLRGSSPTGEVVAMAVDRLLHGIRRGEVGALARAISLVENGRDGYEALLSQLHSLLGRAHRIGVTGPPGAGKSTLTERLIHGYRARGRRVAVTAVDPTSPFSGGALLGDRIRMESAALDPDVFIRSMATRGAAGGLATTTREVCDVLDAFGFERIIIETVGVGQVELSVAATADTSVLVLVPESGDGIQVLKAGLMEIADIFVVNKADRPAADRLQQEIEVMLGLRRGNAYRHVGAHHGAADRRLGGSPDRGNRPSADLPNRPGQGGPEGANRRTDEPSIRPERSGAGGEWEPPVLRTVATKGDGVDAVIEAVEAHAAHVRATGELSERRRVRLEGLTREVVERSVRHLVWENGRGEAALREGLDDVVRGIKSPYELAREIVEMATHGGDHGSS